MENNNSKEESLQDESLQEESIQTTLPVSSSDLKTISIKLEGSHSDLLDYTKLSLQKLRTIVSEKGLSSDSSKLKKNELLKLLTPE